MRVHKIESVYIFLIIAPRGLGSETNLLKIMDKKSYDVARFDLGNLFQGQLRVAKFKSGYNSHTIAPRGLGCETSLLEIMD